MGRAHAQLSVEGRRKIGRRRNARVSPDEMARVLGRHRSTIFRELRRNHFQDRDLPKVGDFAMAAQIRTADRRARHRKLVRHEASRTAVEERLRAGWTPERIAGRMRLQGAAPRVRRETVHRHVHSKDGMRSELRRHSPNHRMVRRPRRARKRRASSFARDASILFRPEAIAHRTGRGHREGDLALSRQRLGQANVTSPMERVSQLTVPPRNTTERSRPVTSRIAKAIGALPLPARRSFGGASAHRADPSPASPFDRGSEFATWPHPQARTGTRSWFCDAQSPHQKGAVENADRRPRRFLPREIDMRRLTDADIRAVTGRMNAMPRRCLGWRTPAEIFAERTMKIGRRMPYFQPTGRSHFA
jgi:IS30 family transposase